ncbi:hydroxymethylbilane synthase [Fibrobacter sp.]|uniref:hydroxymethylbilane synthase n=1 Tax=Fibrobacter sp. TaxID=35828 RepID=UPI0025C164CA|nr:hydroxymethylbilane synthase [Fibrobacter sp.]MCI6438202.1 hydroxymethylbilane synthase [Fibrobacter sp.]MDD7497438.1 hydroxymethylbilane synthase [Fibrobacter sp.]MDY5724882.1 hydroxymethylbilane synthase [Fibrobacter sp.]
MSEFKLRVATRKSALAMAQTTMVAEAIVQANPDLSYELVSMTTEGDRRLDKSLASFGGKGVFIKELEVALLEGRADIAVHSLKDMPAEVLPEFKLAAVLHREDPRDAFVARGGVDGCRFMELPAGARIGTGSIRRVVQLKALRPDLEYVPVRGNIQTRLSKLAELDGVVLAAAGLKRMGLADQVTEFFSTAHMLPASGQGILAIETLSPLRRCEGDRSKQSIDTLLARVNDTETFAVAAAEMAYLKALNAGCQFPVASFAEFVDTAATADGVRELKIRGIYWDENSQKLLRAEVLNSVSLESPDLIAQSRAVGVALAQKIREQM